MPVAGVAVPDITSAEEPPEEPVVVVPVVPWALMMALMQPDTVRVAAEVHRANRVAVPQPAGAAAAGSSLSSISLPDSDREIC
jgi:hypothetical protein